MSADLPKEPLSPEVPLSKISHISEYGIKLLAHGRSYFLPYEDYSWFAGQPERAVRNVTEVSPGHFYWEELDVDLSTTILEHPERFPLIAKQ